MLEDPEFWVALAFAIFVGILMKLGVPKMAFSALDARSDRIRQALDEAHRLRSEAQDVLVQYQKKRDDAEKEARSIIENASIEAERLAAEAKSKVEELVARRTKMAETKIAQAEAQALADVRSAAADAAVIAAEKILAQSTRGASADTLIAKGIGDLKAKLKAS
ncbi:MAG: ATP F0F1 synthase subunit B [Xanthobacteraceae bacterium]|nr:ATP F0F1 synthase subunit B [Xanthobacteraceae bacterium]